MSTCRWSSIVARSFSTRFKLLGSLVLFAALSSEGGGALAQCFPDPVAEVDASAAFTAGLRPGPIYAVSCPVPSQPPACVVPSAPSFSPLPASAGGNLTQEGVLSATAPSDGGNPWTSVVWAVDYFDAGTYHTLFQVDSTDSKLKQTAGTVSHGATGLVAGHGHRARVAYCRTVGSQRGCTCWSSDTAITAMRSDFPALKPTPPSNTVQRVEDDFQRAYTTRPKKNINGSASGGDGLGPDGVWEDKFSGGAGAGNGSFICKRTTNGSSWSHAIMGQGRVANYSGAWQTHHHSYSEVEFQMEPDPECDGTDATIPAGYNMDVRARYYTTSSSIRSYWVKLNYLHHSNQSSHPTLVIGRSDISATNSLGIQDRLVIPFAETQDSDCTNDQSTKTFTDCSCWPRIAEGRPVFLRIEAKTDPQNSIPNIRATVAWEGPNRRCSDSGTGDILDCPFKCSTGWYPDNDDFAISNMNPENGQWGLDSHEGNYRVLLFRAGNEVATP